MACSLRRAVWRSAANHQAGPHPPVDAVVYVEVCGGLQPIIQVLNPDIVHQAVPLHLNAAIGGGASR